MRIPQPAGYQTLGLTDVASELYWIHIPLSCWMASVQVIGQMAAGIFVSKNPAVGARLTEASSMMARTGRRILPSSV